ncbi:hypothetical protein QUF75_15200 [Desulfococcaceae bacterium HSG7]|nr:hypothetical protein [Desulfococcaceae bacterium HSG7]
MFELIQEIKHPLVSFQAGHINDGHGWSKILNISYSDFYYYLDKGYFKNWFKKRD